MARIVQLEIEENKVQRRMNRADIVISGLPSNIKCPSEPVLKICSHFGIDSDVKDINHCIYIQHGKSLLVKFNNVCVRDDVMKAYFKNPCLKLNDAVNCKVTGRIYLNDNLTPAGQKLQHLCRFLRKQNKVSWFCFLNRDISSAKIKLSNGESKIMSFDQCLELKDVVLYS